MKKQDPKSVDLVHQIRFNKLGEKQWTIAENFLGMSIRNWRSLRNGSKNFSPKRYQHIMVMLLVHRMSHINLYGSNPFVIGECVSVRRARSSDDLIENLNNINQYLKHQAMSDDYGIHGLLGAVSFAIWALKSYLLGNKHKGNEDFLIEAIKHWKIAAELTQGINNKKIISKTFAINALTASIYQEVFYYAINNEQKPNEEHHRAYREFAQDTGQVSSWRDALEQSALLCDSTLVNHDFKNLLKSIDRKGIIIDDEYEVVLRELRSIDGFSFLKQEPAFINWEADVTLRYQKISRGMVA